VALMQHSGGAFAYSSFIKKYIHSKRSAETSSLILSTCLFIDDYFNSLTVGSIMYPLTDANKVPRVKLAFLVHSLSSPLVILCPISSWVAAILGFLNKSGIAEKSAATTFVLANPLVIYFKIIPFIFYSFILIIIMWYITQTRISFASMKKHEDIAEKTGNLFGGKEPAKYLLDPITTTNHKNSTLLDFFFPILTLIICILLSMLYSGKWVYLGGQNDFIKAFQNSSAATALFLGGSFSLIICTCFLVLRNRITMTELPKIFSEGINLMFSSVVTIMLAWSFGYILSSQLHTGEYLAHILISSVNITVLPALLFIAALSIAFTIGTAWGTAAMLFPIAIPMVPAILGIQHIPTLEEIPILVPVLGAILSGSVAGNHVSPIADTTIMSATSTRTPIMDHVRTQLPYAIPIMLTTSLGFLLSAKLISFGFAVAAIVPITVSSILAIVIMHILHMLSKKHG
jgi:Na+/H+ antiporter NhaC